MAAAETYDVAIVGLGAMGSAAAAECAARGARTVGFERFARGHALGASNGKSRIVRQAYYEHAAYVPLLLRAYERWRALEAATGTALLERCGLLMCGTAQSEIVAGALDAARLHDLDVRVLEAAEVRARYPTVRLRDGEIAIFEASGGYVRPEAAVEALQAAAEAAGARLAYETPVLGWEVDAAGVRLRLRDGEIRASRLVLAMGPWFGETLASLGVRLRVQRNVQVWFRPDSHAYELGRFPVFLLDRAGLPAPLYGFPDDGDGVKAAFHGYGVEASPDTLERGIVPARDVAPVAAALEGWMPGAAAAFRDARACMYALTPDAHFVLGAHPGDERIVLCGGFSGHGFKFASVVGEIAADLALAGGSPFDLGFLSPARFAG